MTSNRPTTFEQFHVTRDGETSLEYGFAFKTNDGAENTLFNLVIGRREIDQETVSNAKGLMDLDFAGLQWVARAVIAQKSIRPLYMKVIGPKCPSDDETLYWSNSDGWVDRESADRLPLNDALRGLHGLIEAQGLELAQ